uniref:Methyltransferase like 23 n=1 Tax=Buteo japonicus TaxID=224669 RepID=A0A8C0BTD3_9AVES
GLAVRDVCVALRRGPGPVPLGPPEKPARQESAGGTQGTLLPPSLPPSPDPVRSCRGPIHHSLPVSKLWFQVGAGVSLPGVLAAKCGAEVTLSDSEELPQCLRNCRRSCLLNRLPHVPVLGLTWGRISPELLSLAPVDIILGSDVFFDPKDFEDILTTIYFLLEKNPHAQFWTTYQVRSADWSIEALLCKWKLKNVHIPLHSFSADKEHLASSSLPGRHTIEMMIISLAQSDGT